MISDERECGSSSHQVTLVLTSHPSSLTSPKQDQMLSNCTANLNQNQYSKSCNHAKTHSPIDACSSSAAITKGSVDPSTKSPIGMARDDQEVSSKRTNHKNTNNSSRAATTTATAGSTTGSTDKGNTSISTSTSGCCSNTINSVYIKNYDTSGICEQNFCLCFTHSVDVLTFLLSLILGRSEHRLIYCARIVIAFLFDTSVSLLFVHFFTPPPSLARDLVSIQIVLAFVISCLAFLSVFHESSAALVTRFSLCLAFPFLEIFKTFIRCSNNLFCREDQENLAQYLSHRPLSSLFFAYVAKAGIFTSGAVTFIGTIALTFGNFSSQLVEDTREQYFIAIGLSTFDLLRNAYQAIVAENNHTSRATRYSDTLFRNRNEGQEFDEEYDEEVNRSAAGATAIATATASKTAHTHLATRHLRASSIDMSKEQQLIDQKEKSKTNKKERTDDQMVPFESSSIEQPNMSSSHSPIKEPLKRKTHRKFQAKSTLNQHNYPLHLFNNATNHNAAFELNINSIQPHNHLNGQSSIEVEPEIYTGVAAIENHSNVHAHSQQ